MVTMVKWDGFIGLFLGRQDGFELIALMQSFHAPDYVPINSLIDAEEVFLRLLWHKIFA